nr:MAG TPA: YopX protein [Caudoviricetes sp.]
MENRFLSRGKRIDNGEWIQGYLYGIWERRYILWGMTNDIPDMVEVDPATVCQCTAMPDKNKKLVFEHDIVWDSDERAFYEIIWKQEDMCWNVEDADGRKSEFEECYGSTIEVNGNRFDNPELLEVQK